jgi:hypothetical protein
MNSLRIPGRAAAAVVAVGLVVLDGLAATPARAEQAVYLGYEEDACGGVLYVRNRYNQWIKIERGAHPNVDVAIDGDGYWHWKCGNTNEKSRGASSYRNRVKRLNVTHSTNGRRIIWGCYDLLK